MRDSLHNKKYKSDLQYFVVFQQTSSYKSLYTIHHTMGMQLHLDRFLHFKLKPNLIQRLRLTKKKFLLSLPWQRTHIPGLVRNLPRNLICPDRVFIGLHKQMQHCITYLDCITNLREKSTYLFGQKHDKNIASF